MYWNRRKITLKTIKIYLCVFLAKLKILPKRLIKSNLVEIIYMSLGALALWSVVLAIPILIDLTHYNLIPDHLKLTKPINFFSNISHFLGVTYNDASNFLSSSTGVLMTMISLFFSNGLNLNKRYEEKVYGIYRKDLKFSKWSFFYNWIRRMNYFSPIIMIYLILTRRCFTGYCVLCGSYFIFMLQYVQYVRSFNSKKELEALVEHLMDVFKTGYNDKTLKKYISTLENIGGYFAQNKEWITAERIFRILLIQSKKEIELETKWIESNEDKEYLGVQVYIYSRYFYENVFCLDINIAYQLFFNLLKDNDILVASSIGDIDAMYTNMIFRGLTDALVPKLNGDKLKDFLTDFTNFKNRRFQISHECGKILSNKELQKQCFWLSVILTSEQAQDSSIELPLTEIGILLENTEDFLTNSNPSIIEELSQRQYWAIEPYMNYAMIDKYQNAILEIRDDYQYGIGPCLLHRLYNTKLLFVGGY